METLYEQDDVEVVKISQRFDAHDNSLNMFVANFSDDRIELLHTDLRYSSENFRLAHNQMDDLCAAWEAYKVKQEQKRLAELKRIAEVESEAYELADTCKAVQVKRNDRYWTVCIPETSWESVEPIYNADYLLSMVKEAVAYYQPIAEAYKLAAQYPAIQFNHEMGTALWFVYIAQPELFGQYAHQDTIVQTVKRAIEAYTQYQDQLIRMND